MSNSSILPRGTACNACRVRKVKCNAAKPRCAPCVQAGRECEYTPMLNTIKRLEVRIQELQDQLYGMMSSPTEGGAAQLRFGELSLEVQAIRPPAHHLAPSLFYIPQALLNWSPEEEMPPQLRLHFLQAFVHSQSQFGLDLYMPRLQQRIIFPSRDTRSLHGSFTSALFLIVCCCFGPEVTQYESLFLQQSRDAGRAALSLMDRLDHYFAGQLLEAQYLLRLGRLRESYLLANTLLRFAMACDLHRISDPRQHMSSYSGLLGQPADIYAVAERINLWWSCYVLAHQLSTLTGLPNDLPAGSTVVTTVFPVSFLQVETKGFDAWSPGSARGLLQPTSSPSVEADSVLSASAKSAILMTNTQAYVESPAGFDSSEKEELYLLTSAAADRMMATLPPIGDIGNINAPPGSGPSPALVQVHVDLQCAVMGLNRRIPDVEDRDRYSNRLKASRTLANLASTIKDPCVIFAHVPLVFPMQLAMSILVEAMERGQTGSKQRSAVRELQTDILAIATFLSELPGFFPHLPAYLSSLVPYLS